MDTRRLLCCLTLGVLTFTVSSCKHGDRPPADQDKAIPGIALTSPAFAEGHPIPARYACDGANISPPLRWDHLPHGTKSIMLTCDDPDAPGGDWTHWVVYNVPSTATTLSEGVPTMATTADSMRQAQNSFGNVGYGGPCPPRGSRHHYAFRLYALDGQLSLTVHTTAADAQKAARGHVLAEGTLTGTYQRP